MPLYDFSCYRGHEEEHFVPSYEEAKDTAYQCSQCLGVSVFRPSCGGRGLLWAEEGRERVIHNLGHDPVTVRSAKEHKEAMKKAGVVHAGTKRGEKGVWV